MLMELFPTVGGEKYEKREEREKGRKAFVASVCVFVSFCARMCLRLRYNFVCFSLFLYVCMCMCVARTARFVSLFLEVSPSRG